MDFRVILNRHDYRDIDESDSEEEEGPDLFEPLDLDDSPLPSPVLTPQQAPSLIIEPLPLAPLRTILPGDKPPILAPEPKLK
jgi:hypothetical protein